MKPFHSEPAPFQPVREDSRIVVENRYLRIIHDAAHGGEMVEAVVKNGTGKNLFAKPQMSLVGIMEGSAYHCYLSCNSTADVTVSDRNGNPVLEFRGGLTDSSGNILSGVELLHKIEYTPWGEALHRVILHAASKIEKLGMVQVGTLFPVKRMNCLAVQDAQIQTVGPYTGSKVKSWIPLTGGRTRADIEAYRSRWLPDSMLVFQRGLEGFQMNLGDDLSQWESIGGTLPGTQMGLFTYSRPLDCYEMRLSALDCQREGQYLAAGDTVFDFSIAFPFVQKKVSPLPVCASNILMRNRGFENQWPENDKLQMLHDAGAGLMRFHNDGDTYNNGIFWRDAAYPPYAPEIMAKMDDLLQRAHEHGLSVVPYFSLHEYHPDAAGFKEHAEEWGRIAIEGDKIIPSFGPNGYFGFQMCLNSGWMKKRIDTIDEVLTKHDFDGVYYDWCEPMECVNPKHGKRHHDFRKLIELLEWSHERVGKEGDVYIHNTYHPNIAAENIATLVLMEECGFASIAPDMFTPQAHFLNLGSRQVCDMLPSGASDRDRLRYVMCAFLNHTGVSSWNPVYLDFCRENAGLFRECTSYEHHTAPGEGICWSSNQEVGMSAYYGSFGKKFVFANLSEQKQTVEYRFAAEDGEAILGTAEIGPLSMKVLKSV